MMFDELVDAGAARALAESGAEIGEVFDGPGRDHFHVAVLGVAYPAAEVQIAGLAMHEPAKSHALHTPADEEVKHQRRPVLQIGFGLRNRAAACAIGNPAKQMPSTR